MLAGKEGRKMVGRLTRRSCFLVACLGISVVVGLLLSIRLNLTLDISRWLGDLARSIGDTLLALRMRKPQKGKISAQLSSSL